MAYRSVTFQRFGGLRLDLDPLEAGPEQAIDGRDFDLDEHGRLRPRAGWSQVVNELVGERSFSSTIDWVVQDPRGTVILKSNTSLVAYHQDGEAVDSLTTGSPDGDVTYGYAFVGGAAGARFYYSSSNYYGYLNPSTWRWVNEPNVTVNGTTDSRVRPPLGPVLGMTPGSDRLVVAAEFGPNGASLSRPGERLYFSEPGAPTTWATSNWLELAPGRGGTVTALVQWREMLFAFKEDRFAVFYGESQLADGTPVFQHRLVERGYGTGWYKAAAAAPEGVYFLTRRGELCLTTGQDVKVVSRPIGGLLSSSGRRERHWSGWRWINTGTTIAPQVYYAAGRVYVTVGVYYDDGRRTPGYAVLAYDTRSGDWLPWTNMPMRVGTAHYAEAGGYEELVGAHAAFDSTRSGDNFYRLTVGFFHRAATDRGTDLDRSSVPVPTWQSGMYELGAGAEAEVRNTWLWGTGSGSSDVSLSMSIDGAAAAGGVDLALPTNSLPGRAIDTTSRRARMFSHRLTGKTAGGTWTVNAIGHDVRGGRPAGVAQ